MKSFEEVRRFDHPALEEEILAWWKAHDVFHQSIDARAGAPTFTFYEGPPTANGRPGIHHVMGRAIKDLFCRYKTMKGFRVERKGGWDTHGLPVEIEVEKALGLEGRDQVETYGIARYNAACRESVLRYKEQWDAITERMGYWVDLDRPYITFQNEYIESVWWLLKQIYEEGLLYQGYKIQWYSPGSGTVLSSHEVSLGYEEVQDPSVYVRFPLLDEDDTSFLAWTTTPWTLISNTALAVGADVRYVKVRLLGEGEEKEERRKGGKEEEERSGEEEGKGAFLILAEKRLEVIKEAYEVVEQMTGRELVGRAYEPPFSYFVDEFGEDAAWRVVAADFVTTEDGTGIVHMAPAFGADDFQVAQDENLPLFNPIAPDGTFTDEAPLVEGQWFKDADKTISRDLRDRGLLYRHETCLHNYPHDWRKGTPLMSYPVESWFIRTTARKDELIQLNETINWQPTTIGTGRFGEWLRGNVDWALSRRRYWGTPLPIWVSDQDPEYVEVVGSIEELREKVGGTFPDEAINPETGEIDLHRPFVDALTWPAPEEKGGGTMRRTEDLIDVWFDSGAMPFAQWHYPFENQEQFEANFPADFIAEGVDQTRGWFYTLHAIATLVKNSVAYKNVVVNGLLLDENGEKMSKTKGNAVDPFDTIAQYGADVVRWYMMASNPPWENLKFSGSGLVETQRKFFGTLGNVYAFFATYANIDGFRYVGGRLPVAERAELDRWILSRMNSAAQVADAAYADYNPTKAARAVEGFVDELSNWYLRRSRRRFWSKAEASANGSDLQTDKVAAYQTVYESLIGTAKLMAPVAPFFSEWLYQALNEVTEREEAISVHLAGFPDVEEDALDLDLERRMGLARTISSIVLALRNDEGINVRQPLPRILVVTGPDVREADVEAVKEIILDEVNVKSIEYVSGASDVVKRSAKPNFKRLGRRLGKQMKAVNAAVRDLDSDAIDRYLGEGGLTLRIDGADVRLEGEDLEITGEGVAGWHVGQEGGVTVALDTEITDGLLREGLAREVVNRVQRLRKTADFDVTDRIALQYHATGGLAEAIGKHAPWIRNETLALELERAHEPAGEAVETFEIGAETLTVGVRRTEAAV
ncbi:MAG: isoleucine--tRNA ligase [Rhodothermales bacterium]